MLRSSLSSPNLCGYLAQLRPPSCTTARRRRCRRVRPAVQRVREGPDERAEKDESSPNLTGPTRRRRAVLELALDLGGLLLLGLLGLAAVLLLDPAAAPGLPPGRLRPTRLRVLKSR